MYDVEFVVVIDTATMEDVHIDVVGEDGGEGAAQLATGDVAGVPIAIAINGYGEARSKVWDK